MVWLSVYEFIVLRWVFFAFVDKPLYNFREKEESFVKAINKSCDSFRKLRESDSYYIDKTLILKEYLQNASDTAVLFARPRRFGKSLTMTMFRDFLDIRQNSKDIFKGLKVMDYPDIVDNYMNQYPVVFLSLKEVFGNNFNDVFRNFQIAISNICIEMNDLLESDKIIGSTKRFFERLMDRMAEQPDTEQSLALLCQMLKQRYGKPAYVIIDEYDVPMAKALGKEHYDRTRDMIEHMLSHVCKTNDNVKAVILSGCLYTVKNSAYTGVNNIVPYSVLSSKYATYIGFTDDDVRKLLGDAGLEDRFDTVEEWYDGYLFGRDKMYCPWDVLRYVGSLLDGTYSERLGPKSYWVNTSEVSLDIIRGFLGKTPGVNESFEQLLAGGTIDCTIDENLPYHAIHEGGENLWSALVETGYLTKTVEEEMPLMPLKIPKRSIEVAFWKEVWNFFRDKVDNAYVRDLVNALWASETKRAQDALNQILEATLSFYHEYQEYSYHLILDGFYTGMGYRVMSELETGYGRSDLIILDPARQRCLVLELKHEKEEKKMESALKEASSQIIKKKYESRLKYEGYTYRLQYAMAFCDKKSLISPVTRR